MSEAPARPARWGITPTQRALAGCFCFGVLWTVIEVGLGGSIRGLNNPIESVWWRYCIHLLLLIAVCGPTRPAELWRTRRPVLQIARSLLMVVMPVSYVVGGYSGVPREFIWSVFWTSPLLIVLFAWLLLGERPSWPMLAITIAGAGAAVLIHGHLSQVTPLGIACALGMTLSFALYVVATRPLRSESTVTNLVYTALGPLVVFGPLMLGVWTWPSLHDAVMMTGIGVAGLFGLWAIDVAAHAAPAGVGAPGLLAQPAGVVVLAGAMGVDQHARSIAGAGALAVILAAAWFLGGRGWGVSENGKASGEAA